MIIHFVCVPGEDFGKTFGAEIVAFRSMVRTLRRLGVIRCGLREDKWSQVRTSGTYHAVMGLVQGCWCELWEPFVRIKLRCSRYNLCIREQFHTVCVNSSLSPHLMTAFQALRCEVREDLQLQAVFWTSKCGSPDWKKVWKRCTSLMKGNDFWQKFLHFAPRDAPRLVVWLKDSLPAYKRSLYCSSTRRA